MELGIVVALGIWGWHRGGGRGTRILLAIIAPALLFGIWGAVDFRSAGRAAEVLRLMEELIISGVASLALYTEGFALVGYALALLSIVHHALVYALGDRLLKP